MNCLNFFVRLFNWKANASFTKLHWNIDLVFQSPLSQLGKLGPVFLSFRKKKAMANQFWKFIWHHNSINFSRKLLWVYTDSRELKHPIATRKESRTTLDRFVSNDHMQPGQMKNFWNFFHLNILSQWWFRVNLNFI